MSKYRDELATGLYTEASGLKAISAFSHYFLNSSLSAGLLRVDRSGVGITGTGKMTTVRVPSAMTCDSYRASESHSAKCKTSRAITIHRIMPPLERSTLIDPPLSIPAPYTTASLSRCLSAALRRQSHRRDLRLPAPGR